jgi:hypothetical protein
MQTTVKNLELSWKDTVEGSTLEELADMAGGLPFEKQREHQLELDREAITRSLYGESHPTRRFLTAHFGEDPVGGVAVIPVGGANGEPENCLLQHELVQRNRDDIRGRLLETVSDEYPDATFHQQIPAQNRTARQYLQRHDSVEVVSTETILQLHWPVSESDSLPELEGETEIPTDGLTTPTWSIISEDDSAREALGAIEDVSIISRNYETKEDAHTRQLLHVDTDDVSLDSLLKTIHNWATDQSIDHFEWPVTESFLQKSPPLTSPMDIINKRIQYSFDILDRPDK